MSKVVLPLPLPRVVTGVLKRCREEERVLVTDTVPLLVPSVDEARAPVVARLEPDANPYVGQRRSHEIRLHAGALWRPVEEDMDVRGSTPGDFAAAFGARLPRALDKGDHMVRTQELADWRAVSRGCALNRGVREYAPGLFSSVSDDGLAAQASLAAAVQGNLAVIGGLVHHRAPAPYIGVDPHSYANVCAVPVEAFFPDWTHSSPNGPGHPPHWRSFAIDDLDGALEFARTMAAKAKDPRGRPLEVMHRDTGWCEPGLDLWHAPFGARAMDWVSGYLGESRSLAGHLDDEGLELTLNLRRLTAGPPTTEAALSAIEAMRELSVRVAALSDDVIGHPGTLFRDACNRMADGILTRMDLIEAPRLGIVTSDSDADAMLGLGAGL